MTEAHTTRGRCDVPPARVASPLVTSLAVASSRRSSCPSPRRAVAAEGQRPRRRLPTRRNPRRSPGHLAGATSSTAPPERRVDPAKWVFDLGDGCTAGICGWGNNEKEYYTNAPDNASLDGQGHLAIVARPAVLNVSCYYGPCQYTSAKITTRGKMSAAPGRVEARIRIPAGQGLWPAFWMLGNDFATVGWPASGELDIMENKGSAPNTSSSAIHGPGYSGNTPFAHANSIASGHPRRRLSTSTRCSGTRPGRGSTSTAPCTTRCSAGRHPALRHVDPRQAVLRHPQPRRRRELRRRSEVRRDPPRHDAGGLRAGVHRVEDSGT